MSGKGLGVHKYPLTDCIYDMGKSIVAGKKASEKSVSEQLKKYENAHEILLDSTTYFPKEKKDEASKVLDDVLELSGK